jgi:hypothetical protein
MTGAWPLSPVGRVVPLVGLGAFGENLGQHNGESRRVCRLQSYPDWILKEYPAPLLGDGVGRLNRLIQLPGQMFAEDRALVDAHTSWPASRVVDAWQRTIGVLIPLAPANFSATRQMPGGRTQRKLLEVDVLALTEARQTQLKLLPQSLKDRISVCASIAAVGALFERHGLVYLDWSYANIFWSQVDHSAYVIDLDGCSFGSRPQIQTPNWEDPLVPRGYDAGNESDRYRVALLIARCLTGRRASLAEIRSELNGLQGLGGETGQVAQLLTHGLNAQTTAERPSIARLRAALEAAKGLGPRPGVLRSPSPQAGGVKEWIPLTERGKVTPKVTIPSSQLGSNRATSPPNGPPPTGPSSIPRAASNSSIHPPDRSPNVPPPSPPSSSTGVLIVTLSMAALVILLLIIFL